ncbi:MAG: hypothetical protein A2036_04250 [Omnitrophica bacterium GWA2_50_21]|nr:MAG: hypothetical protein A2036_04250 [Omnitrophica bacterium GWA2_50_21]
MPNENEDQLRKEVFERLKRVLMDLLRVFHEEAPENQPTIEMDTDVVHDLGVDSIETLDLMNAIEEEFKINPNLSEANTKRKVGQIVDYIIELSNK